MVGSREENFSVFLTLKKVPFTLNLGDRMSIFWLRQMNHYIEQNTCNLAKLSQLFASDENGNKGLLSANRKVPSSLEYASDNSFDLTLD